MLIEGTEKGRVPMSEIKDGAVFESNRSYFIRPIADVRRGGIGGINLSSGGYVGDIPDFLVCPVRMKAQIV